MDFCVIPPNHPDNPGKGIKSLQRAARRQARAVGLPDRASQGLPDAVPALPGQPQVLSHLNQALTAEVNARSLLRAQGAEPMTPIAAPMSPGEEAKLHWNWGRSLMSPDELPDEHLLTYLMLLAPLALSGSAASSYPDEVSPRLVPLLLGGVGTGHLEALTERTLDLLGFEEDLIEPSLSKALHLVGFGAAQRHHHIDNLDIRRLLPDFGEEEEDYINRLRATRNAVKMPPAPAAANRYGFLSYYLRHTKGSFAEALPAMECYGLELDRKVLRHKWAVMAQTTIMFNATYGDIPQASRDELMPYKDWLDHTAVTAQGFARAVRLVFERPWHELDLTGEVREDVVRVMAKLLIHRLVRGLRAPSEHPVQVHPRALVGMSLLTGIPTPKLVRFALSDLRRRGETFISGQTVRDAVDLVDCSEKVFHLASSDWMREMTTLALQLDEAQHAPRAYFARQLRRGRNPLSSSRGVYQIVEFNKNDEPVFRPRLDKMLGLLSEEM